jgi:hypothetical protein
MKCEDLQKIEQEITLKLNSARDEWIERFGAPPELKLSCFELVKILEKLGLIHD